MSTLSLFWQLWSTVLMIVEGLTLVTVLFPTGGRFWFPFAVCVFMCRCLIPVCADLHFSALISSAFHIPWSFTRISWWITDDEIAHGGQKLCAKDACNQISSRFSINEDSVQRDCMKRGGKRWFLNIRKHVVGFFLFFLFFFFFVHSHLCSDLRLTLMADWNPVCFSFFLIQFWVVKQTAYSTGSKYLGKVVVLNRKESTVCLLPRFP